MKTRDGLTRGMALGLLLLGVVVAFASYRIGRSHEIKGAATGGRELGTPSKSVRERPSDVLATVLHAGGKITSFRPDSAELRRAFMDLTQPGVRD